MKVIQAFSWGLFGMFVIAFGILLQLVTLAQQFGRFKIWSEPIRGEDISLKNDHNPNHLTLSRSR